MKRAEAKGGAQAPQRGPQAKHPSGDGDHGHGIDVHKAMAWLLAVFLGRKEVPPVEENGDPSAYQGGTPNMKLLYAALLYVWAIVSGGDKAVARERVLRFLNGQQRCHGSSEPTSSTHGQLWLAGVAAILWAAEKDGDSALVGLAVLWFQVEHAIHTVARTSDDGMWSAGARGLGEDKKPQGANVTRPRMWAAITKGRPQGKANQYDMGAWFISGCSDAVRAQIRQWPATFPPMAGVFHARRLANGDFVTWYESLDGCLGPVLSAGVADGQRWIAEQVDDRVQQQGAATFTIDAPKAESITV